MTNPDTTSPPKYEFAEKYDPEHARMYFEKHNSGFWRRLSTWREVGMARKALQLAGNPQVGARPALRYRTLLAHAGRTAGAQDLRRRQQPER
jgi:hypothetical protein